MQREAEQRVREMQTRARLLGGEQPLQNLQNRKQTFGTPNFPKVSGASLPFNLDNDKLIILALLWVLYNEGADSKLLLALLYLLL